MAFPEGDQHTKQFSENVQHIDELLEDVRHTDQLEVVPGVDNRRRPHRHSRGDARFSPDPGKRPKLTEEYHQGDIQDALNQF